MSVCTSLTRINRPSCADVCARSNKNKTFKPVKSHGASSTKRHKLSEYAKATLGSGNMRQAVVLPKGEDVNEWLAVNTVDFFNEISLLYGTITESDSRPRSQQPQSPAARKHSLTPTLSCVCRSLARFCLPTTCPVMCAGPNYQYLWADTTGKYKQPVKVSAPEYVDLLMSWVEAQLNDETLFPLQLGTPFPKNFQAVVKNIFKRLFRVYAHIYHSHFQKIVGLGAEAHLNTCFKHVSEGLLHARYAHPAAVAALCSSTACRWLLTVPALRRVAALCVSSFTL